MDVYCYHAEHNTKWQLVDESQTYWVLWANGEKSIVFCMKILHWTQLYAYRTMYIIKLLNIPPSSCKAKNRQ